MVDLATGGERVPMKTQAPLIRGMFNSDPERSYTLPGNYYWSPDIALRERELVFYRSWLLVGFTHDLKLPGSYFTTKLFDQPILVVRGKDDRLRAFYNVCKHRGHLLLEGKGKALRIRCPFHAWTYDLTGQLVAAPNAENVPDFDFAEFQLSEIRVEEVARMVFVNLDPDAKSFAETYPGLATEFRETVPGFDDLVWVRQDRYDIKANWKAVFDGLECYHCPYIHPGSMGSKNDRALPSFESTDFEFHARHIIRGNPEIIDSGRGEAFGIAPNAALRDLHMWYVWPNILFMAHPGASNFKVAHAWPTSPETTVRFIDQFTLNDPPSDHDLKQMAKHKGVFQQDIDAMERVQQGVHARNYAPGRLMVDRERSWKSEHATHHFQNLVWRALNGPN
jgi:carnitine monooxygenase subunit